MFFGSDDSAATSWTESRADDTFRNDTKLLDQVVHALFLSSDEVSPYLSSMSSHAHSRAHSHDRFNVHALLFRSYTIFVLPFISGGFHLQASISPRLAG